jgi:hypothetical protein
MNSPNKFRTRHFRRAIAVAAGVAVVPALFAVANASTGGGNSTKSPSAVTAKSRTTAGNELESEHGVVVSKPHGGAPTPSVPEVTIPAASPQPVAPAATVPEPGDDNGVDPQPEAEPGDDKGVDPTPEVEPGDDKGGSGRAVEPGDDSGGRSGRG